MKSNNNQCNHSLPSGRVRVGVLGAGNMGGALIKGWQKAGVANITITAHTQQTLDKFEEVKKSLSNAEAVKDADVVVIAVKPWLVDDVLAEINDVLTEDKTVISVAAKTRNPRIDVYAMPNIGAEYGEGMTFIQMGAEPQATALAEQLFGMVGKVMTVSEQMFNAGNMLAGCGIAYVMRFIRAMMEGGVELGLYPDDAKEIVMQTMRGAVAVLKESGLHPEQAIDKVTTPGGMTIKGLNELDHSGFNSAVVKCLKAGLK